MNLITLKPGDEVDATSLQHNFEELLSGINQNATINTRIDNDILPVLNQLNGTDKKNREELEKLVNDNNSNVTKSLNTINEDKANKDLSNIEADVLTGIRNSVFPKWEARESKIANTEYKAETSGFVYIATNENDNKSYGNWDFSISEDGNVWIDFAVKTTKPDTGRDNRTVFFPIAKGYYYKAPSRSFAEYYFIPIIGE